ncbi:MAG: hypothetical protein ACXWF8_18305 [Methylobacter sp.]
MKINLPVTYAGHVLCENGPIVTQTDLKEGITFANEAFIGISGHSAEELIDSPHKIVRRPDIVTGSVCGLMGNFKKRPPLWRGFVKNRSKNADSYWYLANVTVPYQRSAACRCVPLEKTNTTFKGYGRLF